MSAKARELFEHLRAKIREIDEKVIEIAEQKSVSYHGPSFFLEVLPRKYRINLLFALDFDEVDDPLGVAQDATKWKFFFHAQHEGGVCVQVSERADIDRAMPIILQAHALS